MIKVNDEFTKQFIKEEDLSKKIVEIHKMIHNKTGKGNDFLGWLSQPNISIQELERLKAASRKIRKESTVCSYWNWWFLFRSESGIELLTDPYKKDFEVFLQDII